MPQHTLMAHQNEGVAFLNSVDGIGSLLWDPGVGKTGATLAWIDQLAERKGEVRVLVVAPKTAVDTWVLQPPMFMDSAVKARMMQGTTLQILSKIKQAGDWTTVPDTSIGTNHPGVSRNRVTIIAMSAGAVSSWCDERRKTVQMLSAIRKFKPDVIVMDESHIIKSATANISKAMYQIGQLADHRINLTGTVNPHSPLDCYGQWRFIAPWTFSDQYKEAYTKDPLRMTKAQKMAVKPWPWGRFKMRYTRPGGYKGKGIGGFENMSDLHKRVAQRSMVVRKEDALDLPPTTDINIHFELNPEERKAYNQMRDELAAEMADGSLLEAPNALAKIMKLRQITAGFVRDTENDVVHVVGDSLQKAVAEVVNVRLDGQDRIVVFAYFRSECQALADKLKQAGRTVELITGATKSKDRLAIRQRFADVSGNPEQIVLVAQARTMSISVNELVTASNAVYASMSERRDDWVQSRGRLDRKGQLRPVTFWNVFCPGTVGEVMINTHIARGDMEMSLLDYIRSFVR